MKTFPEHISFQFPWRKYQQELLNRLEFYLKDNSFHIIAPPGSGKTVLGLEVMLRIGKPTLIFSPTVSIKNQWISRFCELFLCTTEIPEWISTDIRNPNFLTIVTYQALHSATKNEEDYKELLKKIKNKKIECIIFDEAHHLKKEWYKSLLKIKDNLPCKTLALTATPPYDVDFAEWKNYIKLNGTIDAEICVPDLIKEKNLCAHQDFVHYSFPSNEEFISIEKQKEKEDNFFEQIKNDRILLTELQKISFFNDPEKNETDIFENLEFYSSVLIFLNHHHIKISKKHLEIIGNESTSIPQFDKNWTEILLNYVLFEDQKYLNHLSEFKEELLQKLNKNGLVDDNNITFSKSENINTKLINSISKLNSIKTIVDFEFMQMKQKLRMVILTDYIRKEYFSNSTENEIELKKIGVLSIFEKLRRDNSKQKKIAVLSGSIVILPLECKALFYKKLNEKKIQKINTFTLSYDENYFQFNQNIKLNNQIIAIITDIFNEGKIEIIIGTKSLLGEGWDAPCINSIILASFVGSFVLSNQMRGRAIRSELKDPKKTSSIWHLVCLNPLDENFGEDYLVMKRRFKSFVGIDYSETPRIQNSFSRVKSRINLLNVNEIQKANEATFILASKRTILQDKWDFAISKGSKMIEEIKIPFSGKKSLNKTRKLYFNHTLKNVFITLFSGVLAFGGQIFTTFLNNLRHVSSLKDFGLLISGFGVLGMIIFGRYSAKALKIYLFHKNISKEFFNIGTVVLKSLQNEGSIRKLENIELNVQQDENGIITCNLIASTTQENAIFLFALEEVVSPIKKPRYLLFREEKFLFLLIKKDYYAVPEIISKNKKTAQYFLDEWNLKLGHAKLFFTQNAEGRKMLIKGRFYSYASNFQNKSEILNEWK